MIYSIIIPTIPGREEYLDQAVKSAKANLEVYMNQAEIIVIQGGSCSENMNEGLRKSKGKWIKKLDDDDLLDQYCMNGMVKFAEAAGHDWIYSNAYNFTDLPDVPEGWQKEYKSFCRGLPQMLKQNTIHGGTTLYKREMLFEVGGFDESLETAEEYDLHLNLLKHGYSHGYYDEFVYHYRLHIDNKSSNMGGELKEQRRKDIETYIKSRYV